MTHRLLSAMAMSLTVVAAAAGQVRDASTPAVGTGVIFGRVTSSDGADHPLRRAFIQVNGTNLRGTPRAAVTDDDGRYVVDGLPDGKYIILAQKPPYVTTWFGRKPGDATPAVPTDLAVGQRMEADIVMIRGAVLSGTVVEPGGRPRAGQNVIAMTVRVLDGKRSATRGNGGSAVSDDRGMFRIYGLAPGDYVLTTGSQFSGASVAPIVTDEEMKWARLQLAASSGAAASAGPAPATPPPPARAVGFAPVYYPGTADLSAAAIVTIGASEQRDGLDIVLGSVPLAKIEGTITNADGSVPPQVQIVLSSTTLNGTMSFGTSSRPGRDGLFSFPNLQPGSYTVVARVTPPGPGRLGGAPIPSGAAPDNARPQVTYAETRVDINGQDVTGLSLVLQPTLTVSGRITLDASASGTLDLSKVRLNLSPVVPLGFSAAAPSSIAADGTFTMSEVVPGEFRLTAGNLPGGWALKDASAGSAEILDAPFVIAPGQNVPNVSVVLSNSMASLSGKLIDGAGKGLPYTLILFSTDRSLWNLRARRTQETRAGADGVYAFTGLPAGDYYFVALSDPQAVDLNDPDSFEALAAAAQKVTLADGEKKQQNFTIKGGG